MIDPDLFEPYAKLIGIEILGDAFAVPENNTLLRCMQYIHMEGVSYGDFCWNGECMNCQVVVENGEKEKAVLACKTTVSEGMKIVGVSDEVTSALND